MNSKNTFVQSKLNKDVDERLVENGQLVHAENIRVFSTEGSDSGVIETIKGTSQLTSLNLTNAVTLGAMSDWSNRLLYYMVTSDEKDLVLEYDEKNKQLYVIAEGVRTSGKTWINFNKYYPVTSIRKIINDDPDKDLLIFTDNYNNIRCANIKRGKDGKINNEEDWKLIKKPPRYPLRTEMSYSDSLTENNLEGKFISFAYRYRYEDGEMSALSGFTNYKFQPSKFNIDYETMENKGMVNQFNAINLYFNTGNYLVKEIEIVFKQSGSNAVYLMERFNKQDNGWGDNSEQYFKFTNNKIYAQLDSSQLFRSYDNVPRKAKTLALAQNRLAISNYTEGYDMLDKDGQKVVVDFRTNLISNDLSAIDITSPSSDGISFQLNNDQLKYDSKLSFDFTIRDKNTPSSREDNVYSEYIINRDYSSVDELLSSEDFSHYLNVILPNAITSSIHNIDSFPEAYSIVSFNGVRLTRNGNILKLEEPSLTIRYAIDPNSPAPSYTTKNIILAYGAQYVTYDSVSANTSLKTLRSYEVGILYMDEDSRLTPTLTCPTNTLFVPLGASIQRNNLQVEVKHKPPVFADRYKFVIKQSKGDYETIYINRFYQDGVYRWAAIEGANKDKVKEGDILIVKSDLGGPLETEVKVRVLEVTRQLTDFIKENTNSDDVEIEEPAGLYIKIKPTGFDMNYRTGTTRVFEGSSHLRYPVKTYTDPVFGESRNNVFTPYPINAGSTVKMYINIKAGGNISFNHTFEKNYIVNAEYSSFKEFFETEVRTLGEFGRKYTNKFNNPDNLTSSAHQRGEGGTYGTGYGFNNDGSKFYVNPWRSGTASRSITTTIKIEIIYSDGTLIFETEAEDINSDIFYETEQVFDIVNGNHQGNKQNQVGTMPAVIDLNFFNCFTQGNGAESYKYKDAFNSSSLTIDIRPTSVITEQYKEIQRFTDITYSEPYVENNGINGLNEFNLARVNYKDDVHKHYGQITHIEEDGTDLLIFQEDKISKVLVGKQMITTAQGSNELTTTTSVLGDQIPYSGTYGTLHPESVSRDANDVYFVDVKRGIVGRKTEGGIVEISDTGMHSYFRDTLPLLMNSFIPAAYDPHYKEYTVSLPSDANVVRSNVTCSDIKDYTNYKGTIISKFLLNNTTGDFTINVSSDKRLLLEIVDDNGNKIDETSIINGSYTYTKSDLSIKYLNIYVRAEEESTFRLSFNCPVLKRKTITTLVYTDGFSEGKRINVGWNSTGQYTTPFKQFDVNTINGVSLNDITVGDVNSSVIPPDNNVVNLSYIYSSTYNLRWDNYKMKVILSNTELSTQQLEQRRIDTAPLITTDVVKSNGEVETKGSISIGTNSYIYIIYELLTEDVQLVARDERVVIENDQEYPINVLSNDTYPEGSKVVITKLPTAGIAFVNSDNIIVYRKTENEISDIIEYKITYGPSESNIATVNLSMINMTARDDSAVVQSLKTVTINVKSNDDTMNLGQPVIVQSPTKGTAVVTNGNVVYTSTINEDSTEVFTYKLVYLGAESNVANVTVETIKLETSNNNYSTDSTSEVIYNVTDNDSTSSNRGRIVIVSSEGGTARVTTDNKVGFTVNLQNSGTSKFTYRLEYNGMVSNTSTVSIEYIKIVAVEDEYTISAFSENTFEVTNNDIATSPYSIVISRSPAYGTASVVDGNKIKYTNTIFNTAAESGDYLEYYITKSNYRSNTVRVNIKFKQVEIPSVPCSAEINVTGNRGVYYVPMNFGTGAGTVGISYNARSIPDAFSINRDIRAGGAIVQTGFVGSSASSLEVGAYNLDRYVYNTETQQFDATGVRESVNITEEDKNLGPATGTLTFEKAENTDNVVYIRVVAPTVNTAWDITGICPI